MRTIKIAVVTAAALAGILAPITAVATAVAADSDVPAGIVLADGQQGDDTPWG